MRSKLYNKNSIYSGVYYRGNQVRGLRAMNGAPPDRTRATMNTAFFSEVPQFWKLNPFYNWKPAFGAKFTCGYSIGRGSGALKGLTCPEILTPRKKLILRKKNKKNLIHTAG